MILHCGLQFYKRPMATLEAFGQMRNGAARLVMVGRADAAFEAGMARLPEAVRARVELPGIVSAGKLKELLATARVMSVPSEYDLPVASPTVLEALASHTPCVVSPSISKIVAAEGKNCFIERTPRAMAARFDELLADENAWARLSAGCAETKLAFDSLTVARQYIQLAQRLRD
jgi:glycosyltransferase involved in cell wall biosynthesis